ncbi:MAG: hypothetical protein A3D92_07560 [Bacteroidetes bacterium RIFCSPHIGHO2_02_FULL_44_7]|nr:MAG: hypothetical protein A3D92_07560 [Bacteroidetes bacterium RIFCSPHIGHO2_02_FULL_44_7]
MVGDRTKRKVGFIAEEVNEIIPEVVIWEEGQIDGIDYAYMTAVLAKAVQELDEKINEVASGQQSILGAEFDLQNKNIINVRNILSASGNWSIDENGKLIVKEIETEKLTVKESAQIGSSEKPRGITLYDPTGDPYCVSVAVGGALASESGVCAMSSSPSPSSNSPSPPEPPPPDTTAPLITIIGDNPATISVGSTYVDPGAIVSDAGSPNIGYTTSVDGVVMAEVQIDTATSSVHTILYSATDQAGNMGTATKTVNVVDPD